jgi:L-histidine N-alpha-methyltransferase
MNPSAPPPEPVWIHGSRDLESIAERRSMALPRGVIPPEFLYVGHRQSELWLEVARCHAPAGLDLFYRKAFAELPIPQLPHLVGLGPGSARKEAALQERLGAGRFTPVDVSDSLALISARRLAPMVQHLPRPLVADLTRFPGLPDWLSEFDQGAPRLFSAFGVTPNLPPEELDPALRAFLRPGDALLISANLMPGSGANAILPQYDNPETRAWLTELLRQWGLAPHLDDLEIRIEEPAPGTARVVARTHWKEDAVLPWAGRSFQAVRGTPLLLFSSLRYAPEAFTARLQSAQFEPIAASIGCGGEEGLWLVKPRD